ncbi:anti-repressor SinI family protein [Natribacillus halophilus]|nr:anti-repressor SinI family protein [Natribacillus halophilus]
MKKQIIDTSLSKLDSEWVLLMGKAKHMGLSCEQVRTFIQNASTTKIS